MGRQWKIGDPVDYTSDGWMDAQNWTPERVGIPKDDPKVVKASAKSDEAWKLYEERRYSEALSLINEALSHYDRYFNDWNRKAIILESLRRYEESKECFERAISLYRNECVIENKARMLRVWANDLYFNSKDLSKAAGLVDEAVSELSGLSKTQTDITNYRNFAKEIRDKIQAIENSRKSKEYNNLKNSLSREVIRELTKDGSDLESMIYCLIRFIDNYEREMNCIFNRVYYSTGAVSGCGPRSAFVSGLLVEFDKSRKYLNSKLTAEYFPGQDHVDYFQMDVETIDENGLFSEGELSELKNTLESEGYSYQGIIIMDDELLIIFTKSNMLRKEIRFSLKDSRITSVKEFFDLGECYYSSRCPERETIEREVKRIENQYRCSLAHIEPPDAMYFEEKYGRETLICKYNFTAKRIDILSRTV